MFSSDCSYFDHLYADKCANHGRLERVFALRTAPRRRSRRSYDCNHFAFSDCARVSADPQVVKVCYQLALVKRHFCCNTFTFDRNYVLAVGRPNFRPIQRSFVVRLGRQIRNLDSSSRRRSHGCDLYGFIDPQENIFFEYFAWLKFGVCNLAGGLLPSVGNSTF